MKFIAISDQHLEAKLHNIPALEEDNRQLLSFIVDEAIRLDVDYLVSVGDLFDNNKPSSETINFVRGLVNKLRSHGIVPVALAGDHSKPINGHTWESVCGFSPINAVPEFAGCDYSDNPDDVVQCLNENLADKQNVEWVFIHGQIPELWPFCEEKKTIQFNALSLDKHKHSLKGVLLGDIHIRRTMTFTPPGFQELFLGYCGSLGVTATDETKKEGYYYYDGEKLTTVKYQLPRKFVRIAINKENLDQITPALVASYKDLPKRPVFLCNVQDMDVQEVKPRILFLYEVGYVIFVKQRKNKDGTVENVNIRSELKTEERICGVLRELTHKSKHRETLYNLALRVITEPTPEPALDEFKAKYYASN